MLTKYLAGEVTINELARKACLKVLLTHLLCLSTDGVSNKSRTSLYNFIVSKMVAFKKENQNQRDLKPFQQYLAQIVKLEIDHLSKENMMNQQPSNIVKVESKPVPEKGPVSSTSSTVVSSDALLTVSTSETKDEVKEMIPKVSESFAELTPVTPVKIKSPIDDTPAVPETDTNRLEVEIENPAEVLPNPEPVPVQDVSLSIEPTHNDTEKEMELSDDAAKTKRKPRKKKRSKKGVKGFQKLLVESNDFEAQETASTSGSELIERASTAEYQPNVSLDSNEWEVELEKLNTKKTKKGDESRDEKLTTVTTEKLPVEVQASTSSNQVPEAPMVQIPASIFQFTNSAPQDAGKVGTKPKPRKKIGPKKIKQRRSTHKDQVNPHYNIENYFTRSDSHSHREKALVINAVPNKLCNFAFQLHPTNLELNMEFDNLCETHSVTGLDIRKLLYWPGVGVKLSLPEIEIVRYCNANILYQLVPPFAELDKEDKRKNSGEVFRFYKNRTIQSINPPEKDVKLSQIMVLHYLQIVLKALSVSKFPKQEELEIIINAFLSDLSKSNACYLKTSFSYSCGNYKYYRVFHPKSQLNNDLETLVLRQIHNPEIVFTITRCNFEENGPINTSGLARYFKAIINEQNPRAINEFNSMLNKGYSVHCVDCKDDQNGQFFGPIKIALLSEHLGKVCTNELICVKCIYREQIKNLVNNKWQHKCVNFKESIN